MTEELKVHKIKAYAVYFGALWSGDKTFEVRLNDRFYKVGDYVQIVETSEEGGVANPTGRSICKRISYLLGHEFPGVTPGYVVMGFVDEWRFAVENQFDEWQICHLFQADNPHESVSRLVEAMMDKYGMQMLGAGHYLVGMASKNI